MNQSRVSANATAASGKKTAVVLNGMGLIMMDRLSEIRARCDAATPGPWYHMESVGSVYAKDPYNRGDMNVADIRGWGHLTGGGACAFSEDKAIAIQTENAAFIANAREDIPYLLAEIERLKTQCDINATSFFDMRNMQKEATARAEKAEAERATYKEALAHLEHMVSVERDGNRKREHSIGVAVAIKRAWDALKGA